jgi:hypothetical protein
VLGFDGTYPDRLSAMAADILQQNSPGSWSHWQGGGQNKNRHLCVQARGGRGEQHSYGVDMPLASLSLQAGTRRMHYTGRSHRWELSAIEL